MMKKFLAAIAATVLAGLATMVAAAAPPAYGGAMKFDGTAVTQHLATALVAGPTVKHTAVNDHSATSPPNAASGVSLTMDGNAIRGAGNVTNVNFGKTTLGKAAGDRGSGSTFVGLTLATVTLTGTSIGGKVASP